MQKLTGEFRDVPTMLTALKPDEPLYAIRPRELHQAAQFFTSQFGNEVAYPVFINPHGEFLRGLYAGGVRHFVVTNLEELRLVKKMFPAAPCSFLHPVKSAAAIREAAHEHDVTQFVVDHADELAKIIVHAMPLKPTVLVRLALSQTPSIHDGKFGCDASEATALMRSAAAEGLGIGLVARISAPGTGPFTFRQVLEALGTVIRMAGIQPEVIVLGGDFPGIRPRENVPSLLDYRDIIRESLAAVEFRWPARLICVPTRALAAAGASLLVKVELRRDNRLYLNDGIYGGMNELRDYPADTPMRVWRVNGVAQPVGSSFDHFTFCGTTCLGDDVLPGPFALPGDIRMGDYIEIGQMGAYSMSRRSQLGGFILPKTVIVNDPAFLY